MSRSNPRNTGSSPVKRYFSFGGGTGLISVYDKDASEKKEFDHVDFTVLDVRNSISGYQEASGGTYSSNLVQNLNDEQLTVKLFANSKSNVIAQGLYGEIKDSLKSYQGAKFTVNILALTNELGQNEMSNIQLSGAALSGWIDFVAKNADYFDYVLRIEKDKYVKRDKGALVEVTQKEIDDLEAKILKNPRTPRPVWFYTVSIVKVRPLTEVEIDTATEADKLVQLYFNRTAPTEAFNKQEMNNNPSPVNASAALPDDEDGDDLPF